MTILVDAVFLVSNILSIGRYSKVGKIGHDKHPCYLPWFVSCYSFHAWEATLLFKPLNSIDKICTLSPQIDIFQFTWSQQLQPLLTIPVWFYIVLFVFWAMVTAQWGWINLLLIKHVFKTISVPTDIDMDNTTIAVWSASNLCTSLANTALGAVQFKSVLLMTECWVVGSESLATFCFTRYQRSLR